MVEAALQPLLFYQMLFAPQKATFIFCEAKYFIFAARQIFHPTKSDIIHRRWISLIVPVFRLDLVKIKQRNEYQRGKSRGKSAVVKHESAVHIGGNGAYRCAKHARDNAVAKAVLTRDRAKPRGKGKSVDIRLRGQRPRNIKPRNETDGDNADPKRQVADGDGKNVARVLSVRRKGQGGKHHADRRTRKANAARKRGEYFGQDEHNIQIRNDEQSVDRNIYYAKRHTEFVEKLRAVARAFYKVFVLTHASFPQNNARDEICGKENEEKHVHKAAICVRKRKIFGIINGRGWRRVDAERVIHKGVNENAEKPYGKPRLIEIVPSVHGGSAGQKRQNDKADGDAAHDGDGKTYPIYPCDVGVVVAHGITEKHLADEGRKRRGEKRDVNVCRDLFLHNGAVEQNADEGRPHIKKIQPVKAVRDDEHIARERRGVGVYLANVYDGVGKKTANGGVKKRASKPAEREIVGDELAWRGQDVAQIVEKIPLFRINDRDGRGNKKKQTDEKRIKANYFFVQRAFCLCLRGGEGRIGHCISFYKRWLLVFSMLIS